ncbi:MAG: hypothetical protein WC958_05855 [Dehalococcoidales bacterium]
MKIPPALEPFLEDIESRIDADAEDALIAQWKMFWNGEIKAPFFAPQRKPVPAKIQWPVTSVTDAINDPTFELMLLSQLETVNSILSGTNGSLFSIRPNYGTTIIPSLFGAEVVLMERSLNTLPCARPFPGGGDGIRQLIGQGIPSCRSGQGGAVLDCTHFYLEILQHFPLLEKYCRVYHPDLQGPMDICEVVWGNDVFFAFYDEADLIHQFMKLIVDTYTVFIDDWFKLVPAEKDFNVHRGWIHPGKIRLSLDSCMNLSPENYKEFVKPYDSALLERYGGIIHSCGKVDHFVPLLADLKGYCAFNPAQPVYNDMEIIYQATIDKKIPLLNLSRAAADDAVARGRNLHGLAHVFTV